MCGDNDREVRYFQHNYLRCRHPRWLQMGDPRKLDPNKFIQAKFWPWFIPCINLLEFNCLEASIQDNLGFEIYGNHTGSGVWKRDHLLHTQNDVKIFRTHFTLDFQNEGNIKKKKHSFLRKKRETKFTSSHDQYPPPQYGYTKLKTHSKQFWVKSALDTHGFNSRFTQCHVE